MTDEPEEVWRNPAYGTTTFYEYDAAEDAIILRTEQDIEQIIESNKEEYNNNGGKRFGEMTKIASIPIVVLQQLVQEGILDRRWALLDEPRFTQWLNDNAHRYMRTFPGNV